MIFHRNKLGINLQKFSLPASASVSHLIQGLFCIMCIAAPIDNLSYSVAWIIDAGLLIHAC